MRMVSYAEHGHFEVCLGVSRVRPTFMYGVWCLQLAEGGSVSL
jgi:hypothetical protein